jgi:hypothetical protein
MDYNNYIPDIYDSTREYPYRDDMDVFSARYNRYDNRYDYDMFYDRRYDRDNDRILAIFLPVNIRQFGRQFFQYALVC